jgi:serine/threonine protein kinase
MPSSPAVSDKAKDFIRKCLMVDENKRLRVKDIVHHEIIE